MTIGEKYDGLWVNEAKPTRLATGEVMETAQSSHAWKNIDQIKLYAPLKPDLRILSTMPSAWEDCAKVNVTKYPIK